MAETAWHDGRAHHSTLTGSPSDDGGDGRPAGDHHEDDRWELWARVVRPYVITGGRTRTAAPTLAVETMLEASDDGWDWASELPPEQRHVVALCAQPLSVAEVAARLSTPLGVVRVLVAEMVDAGLLHVLEPITDLAADVALLQRLIARVKAIPA